MPFPLYRRPGTVVFLDDEPAYLDMLAEVMPEAWDLRLFVHPDDCLRALQKEPARWEIDLWRHQDMLQDWRRGQNLVPLVLRYWREDGLQRYGLCRAWAVDYSMPALNGLQTLQALDPWPASRILLTGRADEQIAVGAFNAGLIDQYIPKQSRDITQRLIRTIERQLADTPAPLAGLWQQTLGRDQRAALAHPPVASALATVAREAGWVEHLVIGQPFGVLGLNDTGAADWLQLERPSGLRDVAELARLHGVAEPDARAIESGVQLFDIELQLNLGSTQGRVHPARALGDSKQGLIGSLQRLPDSLAPGPAGGLGAWRARRGERRIESASTGRNGDP